MFERFHAGHVLITVGKTHLCGTSSIYLFLFFSR